MRLFVLPLLFASAFADVFFWEKFDDAASVESWVKSKHEEDKQGDIDWSAGIDENDKGMRTTQPAKFYWLTRDLKSFNSKGKTLIVQYTMKHEKKVTCGGSYIKLLGSGVDSSDFHGHSPYKLMFGPDICGTRKVHVIINYKGENVHIKKEIPCKDDVSTHLYSLEITPDNKYKVHIDCEEVREGSLEDDFDFLKPRQIDDPEAKKPDDWVDEFQIDDPEDKKPVDWVDVKEISDPDAKKPDDWDDDNDGEWQIPIIPNPEYKGEWKPKKIANPKYIGEWVHPQIDNPEYVPDPEIYAMDIEKVAIDVWQVEHGSIYDNILVTDDVDLAKNEAKLICEKLKTETVKEEKKDEVDDVDSGDKDDDEEEEVDEDDHTVEL